MDEYTRVVVLKNAVAEFEPVEGLAEQSKSAMYDYLWKEIQDFIKEWEEDLCD